MTQEEKAKAYDEAIKKFDVILNLNTVKESGIIFADDVRKILPELAESEDERIRKELIKSFNEYLKQSEAAWSKDVKFKYVNVKDAIAWLEKQGEPTDIPADAVLDSNKDGLIADTVRYKREKRGEQKPANTSCLLSWTENEEKMLQSLEGIVKDYWAKAEQENNEIQIKEVSDVSYFLKTIKKSPLCWIKCSNELPNKDGIYLVVTDGRHNDVYDIARYDSIEGWHKASEIIYWMPIPQLNNKSIIEQKPAEWSEEDEERIKNILFVLGVQVCWDGATGKKGNPYQKEINWLKSLRPQSTWMPSDFPH